MLLLVWDARVRRQHEAVASDRLERVEPVPRKGGGARASLAGVFPFSHCPPKKGTQKGGSEDNVTLNLLLSDIMVGFPFRIPLRGAVTFGRVHQKS